MGGTSSKLISFDKALKSYKENCEAMRIILLEFAKTDYLGTEQFEKFEEAVDSYDSFIDRSLECNIIYKGKEKKSLKVFNDLIIGLNEGKDDIYIGKTKLDKDQMENLLGFYMELDGYTVRRVLAINMKSHTQLKF